MSDPKTMLERALAASLHAAGARAPRLPRLDARPAPRPTPVPGPWTVFEPPLTFPQEDAALAHLARLTEEMGSPLAAARFLFGADDDEAAA